MRREPSIRAPAEPASGWREWTVFGLLAVHLLFLPWSIGNMPLWSQKVSLGLAAVTFAAGLLLRLTEPRVSLAAFARSLLCHPPLWLGALLIALIATQALNPASKYVVIGDLFFMVPIDSIRWLPAGIEAPLRQMSPFRHLLIVSAVVLAVLTAGLFLKRRRSIRLLFAVLAMNGLALAGLGFAQVFLEADKIFWFYETSHDRFYGTFIYRNHAAAYLNIVFAVSVGLYFFYRERTWGFRRGAADISPLFFFTALAIFTLALFSQSRTGTVIAVVLLVLSALFSLIHGVRWQRLREAALLSAIYSALFAVFVATFIWILGLDRITERFARLAQGETDTSMETRLLGYKAGWEMWQDAWLWGWGAGSFEYHFPAYQQEYPEIHTDARGRRLIWEYAHNDPLQYLIEYGAVGVSLILLLGGWWAWQFIRRRIWRRPLLLFAVIGGLAPIAHSFVDFPLQNPAILVTAGVCFALTARYLRLEADDRERQAEERERPPVEEPSAPGHSPYKLPES